MECQKPYIESGSVLYCKCCQRVVLVAKNNIQNGDYVIAEDFYRLYSGRKVQIKDGDPMYCSHCGASFSNEICNESNWSRP